MVWFKLSGCSYSIVHSSINDVQKQNQIPSTHTLKKGNKLTFISSNTLYTYYSSTINFMLSVRRDTRVQFLFPENYFLMFPLLLFLFSSSLFFSSLPAFQTSFFYRCSSASKYFMRKCSLCSKIDDKYSRDPSWTE